MILTHYRNVTWQKGSSLWGDCVAKSPNKTRPYINLSAELILEGYPARAVDVATRGIQIEGNGEDAYILFYHVGVAQYMMKDLRAAYPYAHRAALIHKDTITLTQLGLILRDMGWKPGQKIE